MTLIAAIRCDGGVVIAADAQETAGDYRKSVQKISPLQFGGLKVVLAGSGNGDLIDSFIVKATRRLETAQIANLADFVCEVEQELGLFYAADVAVCPDQERSMRLLVAATLQATQECNAWISKNVTLAPLGSYDLIGWDEQLYRTDSPPFVLDRPCIHSTGDLGSPVHIGNCRRNVQLCQRTHYRCSCSPSWSFSKELEDDVARMMDRLMEYEAHINQIFMLCADTTTSSAKLDAKLAEFASSVSALHESHVQAEIRALFMAGFDTRNWAVPKIPPGTSITLNASGGVDKSSRLQANEALRRHLIVTGQQLPEWLKESDPQDQQGNR